MKLPCVINGENFSYTQATLAQYDDNAWQHEYCSYCNKFLEWRPLPYCATRSDADWLSSRSHVVKRCPNAG